MLEQAGGRYIAIEDTGKTWPTFEIKASPVAADKETCAIRSASLRRGIDGAAIPGRDLAKYFSSPDGSRPGKGLLLSAPRVGKCRELMKRLFQKGTLSRAVEYLIETEPLAADHPIVV